MLACSQQYVFFPTNQIVQGKKGVGKNKSEKTLVVRQIIPGTNPSKLPGNKTVFYVMLFLGDFLTHLAWKCVAETMC